MIVHLLSTNLRSAFYLQTILKNKVKQKFALLKNLKKCENTVTFKLSVINLNKKVEFVFDQQKAAKKFLKTG